MVRKDFLLVGGWMLATVGILAAVMPQPLSATDAAVARPAVQQPKISAKGYTLAVEWVRPASGEQIAADTRPVIQIIASSNSPETLRCAYKLTLMSQPETNPMARTIAMPRQIWQLEDEVSLAPAEEKRVTLTVDHPLPAGASGYFTVISGEQTIMDLNFTVQGKPAKDSGDVRALLLKDGVQTPATK